MITIVHKIKLLNPDFAGEFENWVKNTDYVTAPKLKSLISFSVFKNSDVNETSFDYFEVIRVSSLEAFEEDMKTEEFESLVASFTKMAKVIEEIKGDFLEPGYNIKIN